jgi:hypothetical protein
MSSRALIITPASLGPPGSASNSKPNLDQPTLLGKLIAGCGNSLNQDLVQEFSETFGIQIEIEGRSRSTGGSGGRRVNVLTVGPAQPPCERVYYPKGDNSPSKSSLQL